MGSVNNFIGRAADFKLDNPALARRLVEIFLNGAKQS